MIDAEKLAIERGSEWSGTEHVLMALMNETGGIAHQVLLDLGITWKAMEDRINQLVPPQPREKPCGMCSGSGKVKF
jgi:ATP-dependent Clp protease ATP-binding subunit ClpA